MQGKCRKHAASATAAGSLPVRPRWLRLAILSFCALLFLAHTSTEVADPDTWQHLASGRYIVEHHAFPAPDPFSFSTAMVKPAYAGEQATRDFNIKHELIAQIVLYLTYAGTGYAGLVLLRCTLLLAFCGIIALTAWRRTASYYAALTAAVLAATVACNFRADRPYLFTFVFLAGAIALLEYRRWLWLPPLFLLWANTHGGFVVGWFVLAAYSLEALYSRWRGGARPEHRILWLAAAASVLVCGLNPTGYKVIPIMLAYRKSVMQTTLWEWQRPALWPPAPFSLLLACAGGVLLWARRRSRMVDWLLLAGFGAAAFMALRNIILAAAIAPLLIVSYLHWKRPSRLITEYSVCAAAAIAATVVIFSGSAFQFRAADWKYPAQAADFIRAHRLAARMFNTWQFGAYLIWRLWPQERVFIDGRAQSETVYLDYQRMVYGVKAAAEPVDSPYQALRPRVISGQTAEQLLDRYGIQMIVMDGFEYTTGSPYALLAALADPRQASWKLIYRDNQALIFMRDPPADLRPLNPDEVVNAMEAQCQEHLRHEPDTPRCATGLSDMFVRLGDRTKAAKWQAIATEHGVTAD